MFPKTPYFEDGWTPKKPDLGRQLEVYIAMTVNECTMLIDQQMVLINDLTQRLERLERPWWKRWLGR